jgi:PleD family two-component response regulator
MNQKDNRSAILLRKSRGKLYMHDISNVALLVKTTHMGDRISAIIDEVKGSSHKTMDPIRFLNIINELGNNIRLVIIDFDMGIEEGFTALKKVKAKNPHVPIIVLTSNNKRELFLKSMIAGAADFILEPFEDEFFKERIKMFMPLKADESTENTQLISKNLDEYINGEISKAKKGKYSFSVLMTTFFRPLDEISLRQENEYRRLSGDLHKNLSEVFWVTDVFIQYGTQSFIGVFPFCDIDNISKIHNKIINRFDEIVSTDTRFNNFYIANVFVTYPIEGSNFEELMNKLTLRMKQTIIDIKNVDKPTPKEE